MRSIALTGSERSEMLASECEETGIRGGEVGHSEVRYLVWREFYQIQRSAALFSNPMP